MKDHLEQQLVNELNFVFQSINDKYKDFFHIKLFTLCEIKDQECSQCINSETQQLCRRCVITVDEKKLSDAELEKDYQQRISDLEHIHEQLTVSMTNGIMESIARDTECDTCKELLIKKWSVKTISRVAGTPTGQPSQEDIDRSERLQRIDNMRREMEKPLKVVKNE